ncbi:response regulator [bacterium]|jgi:hypothetical protein|nr:response regulator [bacterium]MBT6832034.1 response regulator [bacterium]MBT6995815.1 response regulator [bacterium]MBT7772374.1 response regulator [bacterium]
MKNEKTKLLMVFRSTGGTTELGNDFKDTYGYEVLFVNKVVEALTQDFGSFDAVLCNNAMPTENMTPNDTRESNNGLEFGIFFAKKVREKHPDLPIILLGTSHPDGELSKKTCFIMKPEFTSNIHKTIQKMLKK